MDFFRLRGLLISPAQSPFHRVVALPVRRHHATTRTHTARHTQSESKMSAAPCAQSTATDGNARVLSTYMCMCASPPPFFGSSQKVSALLSARHGLTAQSPKRARLRYVERSERIDQHHPLNPLLSNSIHIFFNHWCMMMK